MKLSDNEKKLAIKLVKSQLSKTNLKLDNYELMATNLLNIYNWDITEVTKYAI